MFTFTRLLGNYWTFAYCLSVAFLESAGVILWKGTEMYLYQKVGYYIEREKRKS